ncbi:hypothetical protein BDR05DRAFT_1005187 [Suillus weaverae]|nr:hypothetical protein BDR05DRAFT_1005187 [Suillus weaverae]
MSSSPNVLIVRAYINKMDSNDFAGAHKYVTDDFVYEAEPKPLGVLGEGYVNETGLDQAGYKALHEKVSKHFELKTTIENITENPGGKIIVRAMTKYQQPVTLSSSAPAFSGETPFTAEYEFVGDKIRKLKVIGTHSFPAGFSA